MSIQTTPNTELILDGQINVFSPEYLGHLKHSVLNSPYLSKSSLSYQSFGQSVGFQLIATPDTLRTVCQFFPYIKPYLVKALRTDCNVYFINALLVPQGAEIKMHLDSSIKKNLWPFCVTVFYVQVDENMQGGELFLQKRPDQKEPDLLIKPKENAMITFKGNLFHGVLPMQSETMRVSLVCEQYQVPPDQLYQVPALQIPHQHRLNRLTPYDPLTS